MTRPGDARPRRMWRRVLEEVRGRFFREHGPARVGKDVVQRETTREVLQSQGGTKGGVAQRTEKGDLFLRGCFCSR